MKTTELFVEQTLTGFLVLTAATARPDPALGRPRPGRDRSRVRDRYRAHGRTTGTFMQFLYDFRKFAKEKA